MDIAEPGYESDTGQRDNPTCSNFRNRTSVVKTEHSGGSTRRRLNREGRAICRIVYAHDWTFHDIGQIFNVSARTVRRAVENDRSPRDLVEEDYARVKDPEYAIYFPPVEATLPHRSRFLEMDDDEDAEGDDETDFSDYEPHSRYEAVYRCNGRPARRAAQDNMYQIDCETGEKRKHDQVSYESASAPPFFAAKKPRWCTPEIKAPKIESSQNQFDVFGFKFADPGYESDTGQRDIPSCENFRKGIPVEKTILVRHKQKVLNREGRAICRIVHAHGWSFAEIARIFGVSVPSVSRAVENVRYDPRDRVEEDYQRVRDPGFAVYFPPPGGRNEQPLIQRCEEHKQNVVSQKPQERRASAPSYPSIFKGLPGYPTNTRISSAPQLPAPTSLTPAPAPLTFAAQPTSSDLPSFLTDVMNLESLSTHHALLSAQGFSAIRLQIMAAWPRPAIEEALARTLMGMELIEAGWESLNARDVIKLEVGVWKLKKTLPLGSSLPPLVATLPLPDSKSKSESEISPASFLQNVMGFDLSTHHELLRAQGLDIARLGAMTTWDAELVREMVGRLFLDVRMEPGPRMSKLEALALEFALRGFGGQ